MELHRRLVSSGAVAFGIISLLPVELILQVGSDAGFAMVFSLLFSAIIWNLGTWFIGLPSSSSHTLIGSIIGVGLMTRSCNKARIRGVEWGQVSKVGYSLLLSPLIGFGCAALLLLAARAVLKNPSLYRAPEGNRPPPLWIRSLLILTCTGVSFAHGSNDGQKGMGLIMLILIGTVPTAYALNRAVPADRFSTSSSTLMPRSIHYRNTSRRLPPQSRRRILASRSPPIFKTATLRVRLCPPSSFSHKISQKK